MTDSRHPHDEVLFDFLEGALDVTHTNEVRAHLERCSACAAFVDAARAGALRDVVEPMPAAASERMHVALAAAWAERNGAAGVGAGAAVDVLTGAEETGIDVASIDASGPRSLRSSRRRSSRQNTSRGPARTPRRDRFRWVTPALAFGVLALLAGTSVFLVDDDPGGRPSTSAQDRNASTSSDDGVARPPESATSESAPEGDTSASATAAPASAPITGNSPGVAGMTEEDDAAAGGTSDGVQQDAAKSTATGSGADPAFPDSQQHPDTYGEPVCVATTDETQLTLPDGRIPQRIITAPLGVLIICG